MLLDKRKIATERSIGERGIDEVVGVGERMSNPVVAGCTVHGLDGIGLDGRITFFYLLPRILVNSPGAVRQGSFHPIYIKVLRVIGAIAHVSAGMPVQAKAILPAEVAPGQPHDQGGFAFGITPVIVVMPVHTDGVVGMRRPGVATFTGTGALQRLRVRWSFVADQQGPGMCRVPRFCHQGLEEFGSSYVAFNTLDVGVSGKLVSCRFLRVHLVAGVTAEMVAIGVLPADHAQCTENDKGKTKQRQTDQNIALVEYRHFGGSRGWTDHG